MDPSVRALLGALADGEFHGGASLAAAIGVSRAAVAKCLRQLDRYGLVVRAAPGLGYRLPGGLELMDAVGVRAGLGPWAMGLGELQIANCIDSTNEEVRRRSRSGALAPILCIAEFQSRGRGRRGREWHSAFGAGVWMSILIRQSFDPDLLGKVSLVAGVAVARVLRALGVDALGIKWPNDLLVQDRKLGGILVEYEAGAGCNGTVTVGVGINTSPAVVQDPIGGLAPTDLGTVLGTHPKIPRDVLAGRLAAAILDAIEYYARHGWRPFADDWAQFDAVAGREVLVLLPNGARVAGSALGIAADGALRVEAADGELRCLAGEVSLRLRP